MTNDELLAAWKRKLPGVEPTDRELTAFALGVEVGQADAMKSEHRSDLPPIQAGLGELVLKTNELIEHLQKTGRLAPCFNLPALDAARKVLEVQHG